MQRVKRRIFSGAVCEQVVFTVPDRLKNLDKAEPRPRFKTEKPARLWDVRPRGGGLQVFQSFGRRWPFPEQHLHDAHFPIAGQPFFAAGISYFLKLSEHRHQSTNQEQDRVNHVIYNSIMASLLSAVKVDEQKRNRSNHIEHRKHYAAKRYKNAEGHPQIWLLPESPQNGRYDDTCRSVGYSQHIAP